MQEEVLARLAPGQRPGAWKVSAPRAGEDPLASPVPPGGVHRSPSRIVPGPCAVLGIEAEIAFRFVEAPHPARVDRESLCAIAEALVLIELCATRLAHFDSAPALCRLADFQSHEAFVVGGGVRDWRVVDFNQLEVTLRVDGNVVAKARGSHPTGDLPAMLAWAVGHCARRAMPLAAGDVVTTGSWTGMTKLAPGSEAIAAFAGIGEARLLLASRPTPRADAPGGGA